MRTVSFCESEKHGLRIIFLVWTTLSTTNCLLVQIDSVGDRPEQVSGGRSRTNSFHVGEESMSENQLEIKPSVKDVPQTLGEGQQSNFQLQTQWGPDHLAQLKELQNIGDKNNSASVFFAAEKDFAPAKPETNPVNKDLAETLRELERNLGKTQTAVQDLMQRSDPALYELEMSRRGYVTNPYKMINTAAGLSVFKSSPLMGSVLIGGAAALQGFDDVKNLLEANTFTGRSKYSLGLLADTAIGAGAISFAISAVPMKYKAPLLFGGMVARAAIDLIPNK